MEILTTLLRNKSVLSHACTFTGKQGVCDVTTPNSNCTKLFKFCAACSSGTVKNGDRKKKKNCS